MNDDVICAAVESMMKKYNGGKSVDAHEVAFALGAIGGLLYRNKELKEENLNLYTELQKLRNPPILVQSPDTSLEDK